MMRVMQLALRGCDYTFDLAGMPVTEAFCMRRLPACVGGLVRDAGFTFGAEYFANFRAGTRAAAGQQY